MAFNSTNASDKPKDQNNLNGLPKGNDAPKSMVRVLGGAGSGSTNTKIRTFSSKKEDFGPDMTNNFTTTMAVKGFEVTIVNAGVYSVHYWDYDGTGAQIIGLSKNSTTLTTALTSNDPNVVYGSISTPTTGDGAMCSNTIYCFPGDVIRPHFDAQPSGNDTRRVGFIVTRVA